MREHSRPLANVVKDYLDSQNWRYQFEAEDGKFLFGLNIDSRIQTVNFVIYVTNHGFTVYGYPTLKADTETMTRVAEYLIMANYGLPYGNFELDFTDGEVRFKSSLYCGSTLPPLDIVEFVVDAPARLWSTYGNGLAAVIMAGADPREEINKAEG